MWFHKTAPSVIKISYVGRSLEIFELRSRVQQQNDIYEIDLKMEKNFLFFNIFYLFEIENVWRRSLSNCCSDAKTEKNFFAFKG